LVVECKETNTRAEIKFSGGNKLEGKVSLNGKSTHRYKGKLFETVNITDKRTNHEETFTINEIVKLPPIVKKVAEQEENESRRVWHAVTWHLKEGELDAASHEKTKVEERQRQIARERTIPFEPVHFVKREGEEYYQYKSNHL
jgi:hypothetical protein